MAKTQIGKILSDANARRVAEEGERKRRAEKRVEFLAGIKDQFIGQRIIDFQLSEDDDEGDSTLVVKLESGGSLRFSFEMNGCEGGYCVATAKVNSVSLRFEEE